MIRRYVAACAFTTHILIGGGALAEPLQVSSSAFDDNGTLDAKYAGKNPTNSNCVGANVSPPLDWSGGPVGVKSYAVLAYDPEGANGLGVSHWVAYGIAAETHSLPAGEASAPSEKLVGGKNIADSTLYYGPCPPPGPAHHYVFTVIATDLAPNALSPGLTREEYLVALRGHNLAAVAIVGRFGRP